MNCANELLSSWTWLGYQVKLRTGLGADVIGRSDSVVRSGWQHQGVIRAAQPIWKRSKIVLIRLAASSIACSGVMFFCVILASAWLQICSDKTAE